MALIRPTKDLRNTTMISELCHESREPIYITKNGYGDLVIMSMETWERESARFDLYRKLSEAESELEDEATLLDAKMSIEQIRQKHGLK